MDTQQVWNAISKAMNTENVQEVLQTRAISVSTSDTHRGPSVISPGPRRRKEKVEGDRRKEVRVPEMPQPELVARFTPRRYGDAAEAIPSLAARHAGGSASEAPPLVRVKINWAHLET